MPRIRCHYIDCIFLEDSYCGASTVELDPDEGCITFTRIGDVPDDEDWEEEDLGEIWDEEGEDLYLDEEEDDDWMDEADL